MANPQLERTPTPQQAQTENAGVQSFVQQMNSRDSASSGNTWNKGSSDSGSAPSHLEFGQGGDIYGHNDFSPQAFNGADRDGARSFSPGSHNDDSHGGDYGGSSRGSDNASDSKNGAATKSDTQVSNQSQGNSPENRGNIMYSDFMGQLNKIDPSGHLSNDFQSAFQSLDNAFSALQKDLGTPSSAGSINDILPTSASSAANGTVSDNTGSTAAKGTSSDNTNTAAAANGTAGDNTNTATAANGTANDNTNTATAAKGTSSDNTNTATAAKGTSSDNTNTATGANGTSSDNTNTATAAKGASSDNTNTATAAKGASSDNTNTAAAANGTSSDNTNAAAAPAAAAAKTTAGGGSSELAPPAGYTASQLIYNNTFSNAGGLAANGLREGVTDVQGQGTGTTWKAAGGTGTDAASNVTTGSGGLSLVANESNGTSSDATTTATFGGNGQPYYVQWNGQGGNDWGAVWMLPQAGGHGAMEVDMQEGNFTNGGNPSDNLASHYHYDNGGGSTVGGEGNNTSGFVDTTNANLADSKNTYGALIQAGQMTMYVNGKETGTVPTDSNILNVPMHMIFSNELQASNTGWIANPASGPTDMQISDVQVYQGMPSST